MTQSNGQNWQNVQESSLPVIGTAARTSDEAIFAKVDKHLDTPVRMFATLVPDGKLNFSSSAVEAGDLAAKTIPPIDDKLATSPAGSINYQTISSPVTGITLTLTGAAYAHPTATVGQVIVGVFVRKNDGSLDCKYSAPDTQANTLALDVGSIFSSLDGLPVGFVYLQCTNVTGLWKTLGSVTSVIENKTTAGNVIYRFGSGGGSGGGADKTYKVTSFSTTGATLKGGYAILDDGRVLSSGVGATSTTTGVDQTVNLNNVLTASALAAIGTINSAAAQRLTLVIDLNTLSAAVTLTDNLRKVITWAEANLRFLALAPDSIDPRRYVLVDEVYIPITVSVWTTAVATVKPSRVHSTLANYFPYVQRYASGQITTSNLALTLTHGLPAEPQIVQIFYFDGTNKNGADLSSHLINKTATQLVVNTADLALGGGQYFEVNAFFVPTIPNVASPATSFTSPWYTSTAVTTQAHGLSDMESIRGLSLIEWDTVAAKRTFRDPSTVVKNFDAVNLYLDWTGVTPSSTLQYRLITGGNPLPQSIPNGAFDSVTNASGAGAPSFPFGASGITTGINSTPVQYKLTKQVIGAVGNAGQVAGGHVLSTKSFPAALVATPTLYSFFNLAANANDGNATNAKNLTNNNATPFTGANVLGTANAAALLNGTNQNFTSSAAFFNPGLGVSFAMGGWFYAASWAAIGNVSLMGQWPSNADRGFNIQPGNGTVNFQAASTPSGGEGNLTVTTALSAGYHHFALKYDATNLVFSGYIDGKLVASQTLASVRGVSAPAFGIGKDGNVGAFFAGRAEDCFFVNNYLLADEDIRKLASYRLDHAAGISVTNQKWSLAFYGNLTDEDSTPSTWMVDKYDTNSLFVDFSDRAATDSVEMFMENRSLSLTTVGAQVPFDTIYTTAPTFPIAHGQTGVPEVIGFGEITSGVWEPLAMTGEVNADSTNLVTASSLATFFTAGYLRVRIVARNVGPVQTGVPIATTGLSGLVGNRANGHQNYGGLKGYLDGAYSVGNMRPQEGGGTVTLTDDSKRHQTFNLTVAETVVLPSTSVLAGDQWFFANTGFFDLTVQGSGGLALTVANGANQDATIQKGYVSLRALQDAPTAPAHWLVETVYEEIAAYTGATSGAIVLTATVRLRRHNKNIVVKASTGGTAASASSAIAVAGTGMPVRCRPLVNYPSFATAMISANNNIVGYGYVGTDGSITYRKYDTSNFSGQAGLYTGGGTNIDDCVEGAYNLA